VSPAGRPEGFEGDLAALSVAELIQTISLGGKTARMIVRSGSRKGELWFKDGQVTHAAAESMFGDLAAYAMVEWTSGHFVVEYGVTSESRSVTQDTTFLVLEGLRRFDERSQSPAPSPDIVEVPPVLEEDVRRKITRRRVYRMMAGGLAVVAIVAAFTYDWRSPSSIDAVAAVAPVVMPAPIVTREKPRPVKSTTAPRPLAKKPTVEVQLPVLAPESPAAEEPIPIAQPPAASQPDTEPTTVIVPDARPRLRISGKSGADGGSVTVFVDGVPSFTHTRLEADGAFQADLVLTPGEHLIVARLQDGARAGVHEASTRTVFAPGESCMLYINANRMFGSPVKIKLDRTPRSS
jgi:hypothetical protein